MSGVLYFVFIGLLALQSVAAAKAKKDSEGEIMRKDFDFMKCDVCTRVAENLAKQVNAIRDVSVRNAIGEFQIVELMDNICKPRNLTAGDWIRRIDVVETVAAGKVYLDLVTLEEKGKCGNECVTVAKSCDSLLEGEIDADDFSAYLYRTRVTPETLQEKLCKKLTKRCATPKKALPVNHGRVDEIFQVMDDREMKMEELSAMMRDNGIRGDLKRRDELTSMLDEYAEPYNPYADDEDDEDSSVDVKPPLRNFAPPGYAKNSHVKEDEF